MHPHAHEPKGAHAHAFMCRRIHAPTRSRAPRAHAPTHPPAHSKALVGVVRVPLHIDLEHIVRTMKEDEAMAVDPLGDDEASILAPPTESPSPFSRSWSLHSSGVHITVKTSAKLSALTIGALPGYLDINGTGATARFHEERLHFATGADRPFGAGLPIGPIRLSTDLNAAVDGEVTLLPPASIGATLRRHVPQLKKVHLAPEIFEIGLEIDGLLSHLGADGANRTTYMAGMRARLLPAFETFDLLQPPEELLLHIKVPHDPDKEIIPTPLSLCPRPYAVRLAAPRHQCCSCAAHVARSHAYLPQSPTPSAGRVHPTRRLHTLAARSS